MLFGSDDGWVYSLDANTGQLAWRFRAAPEERYIHVEGQINSAWPSAAGVIVDGGIAYCAAGLIPYDGTYLYALDMKTGKAVWAKRIGDAEQQGGSPQGTMALAGDTLVVPSFIGQGSRAYRKANGEAIPWYVGSRKFWTYGTDAVADGDVWFYGGSRHGNDTDENKRRDAGARPFTVMDIKTGWVYAAGDKKGGQIARNLIAPVLGKTIIVGDGVAYDRVKYCEMLLKDPVKTDETQAWSVPLWSHSERKTSALALAGDVVLAGGNSQAVAFEWLELGKEAGRPKPQHPEPCRHAAGETSAVVAFEAKAGGKELGRVTVPGTILRNSLAVAGGKVFVVTEEGSVCCLNGD